MDGYVPFSRVAQGSRNWRDASKEARGWVAAFSVAGLAIVLYAAAGLALGGWEYLSDLSVGLVYVGVVVALEIFILYAAKRRAWNIMDASTGERRQNFAEQGAHD